MSILTAAISNVLLKETPVKNNEFAKSSVESSGKPSVEPKGQVKTDDGNAFKKILLDKKTKSENNPTAPKNVGENVRMDRFFLKVKPNSGIEGEIKKGSTLQKEAKKPVSVKDLLSNLLEKGKKTDELPKKAKEAQEDSKKKIEDPAYARSNALFQRIDAAKKKISETMVSIQALQKSEKEKSAPHVVIIDLRTKHENKTEKTTSTTAMKSSVKAKAKETEARELKKPDPAKDQFEVKLFTKSPNAGDNIEQSRNMKREDQVDTKTQYSARLNEALRNEIVRHTGIIVKNGGDGEINLVLKPESLGSVRIKLNIEDNNIVGKIIVDNNTVKEIMEENLVNLENALRDNGYKGASFDVLVAGDHQDQKGQDTAFSSLFGDNNRSEKVSSIKGIEYSDESVYDESLVNILL